MRNEFDRLTGRVGHRPGLADRAFFVIVEEISNMPARKHYLVVRFFDESAVYGDIPNSISMACSRR